MENVLDGLGDVGTCREALREILRRTGPQKVIEIGTAYGEQLSTFGDLVSEALCVDVMYDWVPDIKPGEPFTMERVDSEKMRVWAERAAPYPNVKLVLGSSYELHGDPQFDGTGILVIDGCHHPAEAVLQDFLNFRKHLTSPYYVIWDDTCEGDVAEASRKAEELLKSEGAQVSVHVSPASHGTHIFFVTPQ